jgi:hypothetical protein
MSRYCGDDPDLQALDAEFERAWGYKCLEIAPSWRKCNNSPRKPEERREQVMIQVPNIRELNLRPIDQGLNVGRECHYVESERRGTLEGRVDRVIDTRKCWTDETRRNLERDMKNDRESLPSLKAVGLLDSFEARTETLLTSGIKGRLPFSTMVGSHW